MAEHPPAVHRDQLGAVWLMHTCRDGARQPARLPLAPDRWQVVQDEPLTIAPSILCLACGMHGWWRDGAWQPV